MTARPIVTKPQTNIAEGPEYTFGVTSGRVSDAGPQITGVVAMSATEFRRFKAACAEIIMWARADSFALVEYAGARYFQTEADLAESHRTPTFSPGVGSSADLLMLNAELLNLLSMTRLYLDHTETQLKRVEHDRQSGELESFTEATSAEFDSNFAYRFCYKLRNYAQHCGFPIGNLHIGAHLSDPDGELAYRFDPVFDRDRLLSDYEDWGVRVREDLQSRPREFPVPTVVRSLLVSLERVHKSVMGASMLRLSESVADIRRWTGHVDSLPGQPAAISYRIVGSEGNRYPTDFQFYPVPLPLLELVEQWSDISAESPPQVPITSLDTPEDLSSAEPTTARD